VNDGPYAIELSSQDKLEVLRRLDRFRRWQSLDDKRYCLCCQQLIIGRQIEVTGGTRGSGPLRLNCPSEGCRSIPMDWVMPTDEVLAKIRGREALPARSGLDDHRFSPRENSIAARLRRHAAVFRRANAHWPSAP
jgi:hypothetical protein